LFHLLEHGILLILNNEVIQVSGGMRKKYLSSASTAIIYFIIMIGCSAMASKQVLGKIDIMGPFHFGSEVPSKDYESVLKEAAEDYNLVIAGKSPVYAKFPKNGYRLTDGGTVEYQGNGYKIKIQNTIANVGGVDGYLYGPVVTFEKVISGNLNIISHIEFYSTDELKRLKNK